MDSEKILKAGNHRRKIVAEKIAFGIFRVLSGVIVTILFIILAFIIIKGVGVLNWDFITTPPTDGMKGGGIWPAIVGTFYLMIGSAIVAFPLGIMSGIYMHEYARSGRVVRFIRMMTNNLAGIPSIVFGLFGMSLFVNFFGFGDSILAGSLTLGLLAMPLVIRTTEEALKAIPNSSGSGRHQAADHPQSDTAHGYAQHHYRTYSGFGPRIGRDGPHTLYLRGILPAATSAQRVRPMYGSALPSVCAGHKRHRHGEADTDSLRYGTCAGDNNSLRKSSGKRTA